MFGFSNKITAGILFSMISFFFTIFVGFYSYRYLWSNLNSELFGAWLSIFEFSQFLLLLDLGFTHSFIRRYSKGLIENAFLELPFLRGSLLFVGLIAIVIIFIVSYISGVIKLVGVLPVACLSGAVLMTLLGYADTALLRLQERFGVIYAVNIFSNFIYILILLLFPMGFAIYAISVAVVVRSFLLYFFQNFLLGFGFKVKLNKHEKGNLDVIYLNMAYFLLFMFDAIIMVFLAVPPLLLAVIIIYKKYYDILRALSDSVLNVLSVVFAKHANEKRDFYILMSVVLLFFVAFVMSKLFIDLWMKDFAFDYNASLSICLAILMITLFRIKSTKIYFQDGSLLNIFLMIFFTKIVFFYSIFLSGLNVILAYYVQSFLLFFIVFYQGFRKTSPL